MRRDEQDRLIYEPGDRINIPASVVSISGNQEPGDDRALQYPQLRVRTQDGRIHTFSQSDVTPRSTE